MTRMVMLVVLAASWGLGVAPAVAANRLPADVPPPSHHTIPDYIDVVGRGPDGRPDSTRGTFVIVIRDMGNNPIPGAQVIVDLGGCPDIQIDRQQWPSLIADCPTKTVRRFTDANGRATFCIVGAGANLGGAPGPGAGCVSVQVDGMGVKQLTATATDENGGVTNPGVDLTDIRACLLDWGSGQYFGRSDFDHDGLLGLPDLIVLLRVWGSGTSVFGPNALCP